MKKRIVIFALISIVIFIFSWIAWVEICPRLGYNSNELNIEIDENIDISKLKIEMGFFSIERKSDREIFNAKKVLIFNGKEIRQIENDYGENDFLITYADSLYFQFRHFKTNNKQTDTYNYYFFKRNSKLFIKASINNEEMKFEREFNLIKDADSLICNSPINTAGYMYNMLEMNKKDTSKD